MYYFTFYVVDTLVETRRDVDALRTMITSRARESDGAVNKNATIIESEKRASDGAVVKNNTTINHSEETEQERKSKAQSGRD